MTRELAPLGATFGVVIVIAALVSSLSAPISGAAVMPMATGDVPISVIIPGTVAPTPTPSTTSGGGSGGGGTGTGSSGGGTTTPSVPADPGLELPTFPDGSPIPPPNPAENAPGLTLDQESYAERDWMLAIGTGYTPGEKVQFVLYPGALILGSYVADATGVVTARIRVPVDTRPGSHVLEATGWQSGYVSNREFLVISEANVAPWIWWVYVVLGVLLASMIALAIYFRETIRGWFGRGVAVAGATP